MGIMKNMSYLLPFRAVMNHFLTNFIAIVTECRYRKHNYEIRDPGSVDRGASPGRVKVTSSGGTAAEDKRGSRSTPWPEQETQLARERRAQQEAERHALLPHGQATGGRREFNGQSITFKYNFTDNNRNMKIILHKKINIYNSQLSKHNIIVIIYYTKFLTDQFNKCSIKMHYWWILKMGEFKLLRHT